MTNDELRNMQEVAKQQWDASEDLEMNRRSPNWPMVMVLCEIALRLLPPL